MVLGARHVDLRLHKLNRGLEAGASQRMALNADRIVIGGGDGTISSALSELLRLDKPLAVLPLGTANDFARTLGVPADAMAAAEVALSGREHRIDVGSVNGRPFINVASVGLAAKVTEGNPRRLKRRWRVLSYLISLWRAVWAARPFYLEIELDGARLGPAPSTR